MQSMENRFRPNRLPQPCRNEVRGNTLPCFSFSVSPCVSPVGTLPTQVNPFSFQRSKFDSRYNQQFSNMGFDSRHFAPISSPGHSPFMSSQTQNTQMPADRSRYVERPESNIADNPQRQIPNGNNEHDIPVGECPKKEDPKTFERRPQEETHRQSAFSSLRCQQPSEDNFEERFHSKKRNDNFRQGDRSPLHDRSTQEDKRTERRPHEEQHRDNIRQGPERQGYARHLREKIGSPVYQENYPPGKRFYPPRSSLPQRQFDSSRREESREWLEWSNPRTDDHQPYNYEKERSRNFDQECSRTFDRAKSPRNRCQQFRGQQHGYFIKCDECDRFFSTGELFRHHWKDYHSSNNQERDDRNFRLADLHQRYDRQRSRSPYRGRFDPNRDRSRERSYSPLRDSHRRSRSPPRNWNRGSRAPPRDRNDPGMNDRRGSSPPRNCRSTIRHPSRDRDASGTDNPRNFPIRNWNRESRAPSREWNGPGMDDSRKSPSGNWSRTVRPPSRDKDVDPRDSCPPRGRRFQDQRHLSTTRVCNFFNTEKKNSDYGKVSSAFKERQETNQPSQRIDKSGFNKPTILVRPLDQKKTSPVKECDVKPTDSNPSNDQKSVPIDKHDNETNVNKNESLQKDSNPTECKSCEKQGEPMLPINEVLPFTDSLAENTSQQSESNYSGNPVSSFKLIDAVSPMKQTSSLAVDTKTNTSSSDKPTNTVIASDSKIDAYEGTDDQSGKMVNPASTQNTSGSCKGDILERLSLQKDISVSSKNRSKKTSGCANSNPRKKPKKGKSDKPPKEIKSNSVVDVTLNTSSFVMSVNQTDVNVEDKLPDQYTKSEDKEFVDASNITKEISGIRSKKAAFQMTQLSDKNPSKLQQGETSDMRENDCLSTTVESATDSSISADKNSPEEEEMDFPTCCSKKTGKGKPVVTKISVQENNSSKADNRTITHKNKSRHNTTPAESSVVNKTTTSKISFDQSTKKNTTDCSNDSFLTHKEEGYSDVLSMLHLLEEGVRDINTSDFQNNITQEVTNGGKHSPDDNVSAVEDANKKKENRIQKKTKTRSEVTIGKSETQTNESQSDKSTVKDKIDKSVPKNAEILSVNEHGTDNEWSQSKPIQDSGSSFEVSDKKVKKYKKGIKKKTISSNSNSNNRSTPSVSNSPVDKICTPERTNKQSSNKALKHSKTTVQKLDFTAEVLSIKEGRNSSFETNIFEKMKKTISTSANDSGKKQATTESTCKSPLQVLVKESLTKQTTPSKAVKRQSYEEDRNFLIELTKSGPKVNTGKRLRTLKTLLVVPTETASKNVAAAKQTNDNEVNIIQRNNKCEKVGEIPCHGDNKKINSGVEKDKRNRVADNSDLSSTDSNNVLVPMPNESISERVTTAQSDKDNGRLSTGKIKNSSLESSSDIPANSIDTQALLVADENSIEKVSTETPSEEATSNKKANIKPNKQIEKKPLKSAMVSPPETKKPDPEPGDLLHSLVIDCASESSKGAKGRIVEEINQMRASMLSMLYSKSSDLNSSQNMEKGKASSAAQQLSNINYKANAQATTLTSFQKQHNNTNKSLPNNKVDSVPAVVQSDTVICESQGEKKDLPSKPTIPIQPQEVVMQCSTKLKEQGMKKTNSSHTASTHPQDNTDRNSYTGNVPNSLSNAMSSPVIPSDQTEPRAPSIIKDTGSTSEFRNKKTNIPNDKPAQPSSKDANRSSTGLSQFHVQYSSDTFNSSLQCHSSGTKDIVSTSLNSLNPSLSLTRSKKRVHCEDTCECSSEESVVSLGQSSLELQSNRKRSYPDDSENLHKQVEKTQNCESNFELAAYSENTALSTMETSKNFTQLPKKPKQEEMSSLSFIQEHIRFVCQEVINYEREKEAVNPPETEISPRKVYDSPSKILWWSSEEKASLGGKNQIEYNDVDKSVQSKKQCTSRTLNENFNQKKTCGDKSSKMTQFVNHPKCAANQYNSSLVKKKQVYSNPWRSVNQSVKSGSKTSLSQAPQVKPDFDDSVISITTQTVRRSEFKVGATNNMYNKLMGKHVQNSSPSTKNAPSKRSHSLAGSHPLTKVKQNINETYRDKITPKKPSISPPRKVIETLKSQVSARKPQSSSLDVNTNFEKRIKSPPPLIRSVSLQPSVGDRTSDNTEITNSTKNSSQEPVNKIRKTENWTGEKKAACEKAISQKQSSQDQKLTNQTKSLHSSKGSKTQKLHWSSGLRGPLWVDKVRRSKSWPMTAPSGSTHMRKFDPAEAEPFEPTQMTKSCPSRDNSSVQTQTIKPTGQEKKSQLHIEMSSCSADPITRQEKKDSAVQPPSTPHKNMNGHKFRIRPKDQAKISANKVVHEHEDGCSQTNPNIKEKPEQSEEMYTKCLNTTYEVAMADNCHSEAVISSHETAREGEGHKGQNKLEADQILEHTKGTCNKRLDARLEAEVTDRPLCDTTTDESTENSTARISSKKMFPKHTLKRLHQSKPRIKSEKSRPTTNKGCEICSVIRFFKQSSYKVTTLEKMKGKKI